MSHTEEIPINKVAISHVVGKGGETIKQLKSSTNTQIDIENNVVRITGGEHDVKRARALIEKIIDEQANPDYEGAEGKRLRAEADAAGRRRDELKAEADTKFQSGDKDAGHKLMAEAKAAGDLMHAKNKEAAAAIVKNRNEGKGDAYLDLHGLRTEEALAVVNARFAELEAKPQGTSTELELIPGAGHHSSPGKVALKPACESLLLERNYKYHDASAGSWLVTVPGKGNKVSGQPSPSSSNPHTTSATIGGASAGPTQVTTHQSSQPATAAGEAPKQRKDTASCCTIM